MDFSIARRLMVDRQVKARGITDPLVIEAMLQVPRHLFVEEAFQSQAYSDFPLPIGEKQTISQPYIVGLMTEALRLRGGSAYWKSAPAPGIRRRFSPELLLGYIRSRESRIWPDGHVVL